jgi:5S rRNA maturation endonuclease (ribonuclease M5)
MKLTFDMVIGRLDELGCQPRFTGEGQVSTCCPVHDDHKPSASVTETDDGTVLAWCHACGDDNYWPKFRAAILDGVRSDYAPNPERVAKVKARPPLIFEPSGEDYPYWDFDGTPLLKRRGRRLEPETGEVIVEKSFQWQRYVDNRWTTWREPTRAEAPMLDGTDPISNQIVENAKASGETLYVVEGEKDANSLISRGIPAVSPSHGAGVWRKDWTEQLAHARDLVILADNDEPGREHARKVAEALTTPMRSVPIKISLVGKDISDHLDLGHGMEELVEIPTESASSPRFIKLSTVERRNVSWFWKRYIPARRLTMIEGHPGEMKSCLTVDLAARASKGRSMPDDTPGPAKPMNVLIISAEDDAADTIRPRLEAADADINRVFVLGPDDERLLSFPDDTKELEHFITGNAIGLVVLDPLNAFLADNVRTNADHSVRRALTPIGRMAQRTGVTMLVIRHLTKGGGVNPLLRGQGSIAFIGAVRAGLLIASKPDEPELRYLAPTKNSLTARPSTLTFRPESVSALDTVRIAWKGKAADVSASDLLAASSGDDDKTSTIGEYTDHLRDYLEVEGRQPATDALRAMRKLGMPDWAARHARQRLGVKSKREGFGSGSKVYWDLPNGATLSVVPPVQDEPAAPIDDIHVTDEEMTSMASMESADEESTAASVTSPDTKLCQHDGCDRPGHPYIFGNLCDEHVAQHRPEPGPKRYVPGVADYDPIDPDRPFGSGSASRPPPEPPRGLIDMSNKEHEEYGRKLRELILGPDDDGNEPA